MRNRLKAWLPNPQTIKDNRWLRWMGPALHHPRLWHFSRKGIAMGLALGIKALFMVLALTGLATMWMAVFADMGASLLVIFNGLRVLRTKALA